MDPAQSWPRRKRTRDSGGRVRQVVYQRCYYAEYVLKSAYRVYDLKVALAELTNVPLERQKILGLVKGKLPSDEVRLLVYLWMSSLIVY